jgi:hypothetical protein
VLQALFETNDAVVHFDYFAHKNVEFGLKRTNPPVESVLERMDARVEACLKRCDSGIHRREEADIDQKRNQDCERRNSNGKVQLLVRQRASFLKPRRSIRRRPNSKRRFNVMTAHDAIAKPTRYRTGAGINAFL